MPKFDSGMDQNHCSAWEFQDRLNEIPPAPGPKKSVTPIAQKRAKHNKSKLHVSKKKFKNSMGPLHSVKASKLTDQTSVCVNPTFSTSKTREATSDSNWVPPTHSKACSKFWKGPLI